MLYFFFYLYGAHRDLHVLTHSFPTRRSSDLPSRADDAFGAMLNAGLQMRQCAFGPGKVDEAIGLGQGVQVVADGHSGVDAQKGAGVLADSVRSAEIGRAHV